MDAIIQKAESLERERDVYKEALEEITEAHLLDEVKHEGDAEYIMTAIAEQALSGGKDE